MISDLIAPLGVKIFGGISLALLIVVAVMGFRLHSAHSTIDRQLLEIKAVTAERDRFQADAQRMVDEGQARIVRGQQAAKEQEPISADLRRQADRIRVVKVPGNCKTPDEVMGATGL